MHSQVGSREEGKDEAHLTAQTWWCGALELALISLIFGFVWGFLADQLCLLQKACIWVHMDINGPALNGFNTTDENIVFIY